MKKKIIDMGTYTRSELPDNALFESILNENLADAVMLSLAQYLQLTDDAVEDIETINQEMSDVTLPDDLAAALKEINRKYIEEHSGNKNNNEIDNDKNIDSDSISNISVISDSDIHASSAGEVGKRKGYLRHVTKVAVSFMLIMVITMSSFAVDASAMRFKLYDIFINHNEGNADVSIKENKDFPDYYLEMPDEQNGQVEVDLTDYFEPGEEVLYPTYLPEGVYLSDVDVNQDFIRYILSCGENEVIQILIQKKQVVAINIDTNKSKNEIITVNNQDGLFRENGELYSLHWNQYGYGINMTANSNTICIEEMIIIAECMKSISI